MDHGHVDALTRSVASGGSARRGLLRLLAGGALGGLVARLGLAETGAAQPKKHKAKSKPKQRRRHQAERKARTDRARRRGGATAQDCDPQTQCCSPLFPVHCGTRSDGSPACCNDGTKCCPQGDHFICCPTETYCCANNFCCFQNQTCGAVGCQGCPTGQTTCPADRTKCVDLQTDPNNCGSCGHQCTGGSQCVQGSCVCVSPTPDVCGGRCVDLQTDPNNCGSCGNQCTDAQCVNGSCLDCPSGDPPCGEQCCNPLLGEVCVSNFGNPVCCAPAKVCGGGCCAECCASASRQACGTSCGPRCCAEGKICVTQQRGGRTQYRCR
jgi:hypothetical protein